VELPLHKNIAHLSKYCKWSDRSSPVGEHIRQASEALNGKASEIQTQIGARKLRGKMTLVISGKKRKKVDGLAQGKE
jgi:16S rRNA C1402 (ribose-2'-O) methylase RsmI